MNHIVCLGDSITFGVGVEDPGKSSWPALLEEKLGGAYRVVNLGVSGTTLMDEAHAPYRLTGKVEEAKGYPYRMAIIMIGTNDAFDPAWDDARYKAQLAGLADEMRAAGAGQVQLVLMAPPAVFFDPERYERDKVPPERMGEVVRALVREVAEEKQAIYVDFYAFTEDHPEWFDDQLHPNAEGYAAMAGYLFEQLSSHDAF